MPLIGRKKLSDNQQEYNNVHCFYRAVVEHLFARLWHWKTVRSVCMGCARDLHGHVRVLLHLTQFCIRRQTRYQPYGPHVPESVWAQQDAPEDDEENDDGVCCQLCAHCHEDISGCSTCHLNMCPSCMLRICNCKNNRFHTSQNQIVMLCCSICMLHVSSPPSPLGGL